MVALCKRKLPRVDSTATSKQAEIVFGCPLYNGKLYAVKVIIAWYEQYDPLFGKVPVQELCRQAMDTVEGVLGFMRLFGASIDDLPLALHYATQFVHKQKGIRPMCLVELLLVSAIITMKFWQMDGRMELNKQLATLLGIPLRKINEMERFFLSTINYELYLSESETRTVILELYKHQLKNCTATQPHIYTTLPVKTTHSKTNIVQKRTTCKIVDKQICMGVDSWGNLKRRRINVVL